MIKQLRSITNILHNFDSQTKPQKIEKRLHVFANMSPVKLTLTYYLNTSLYFENIIL